MKTKNAKRALWVAAGAGAVLLAAVALRADQASENAAEAAATKWLSLVDSGRYAESWKEAASLFKKQVTAEQWESAAHNARGPLGKLISRKLSTARYATSLPGAPDGEYVVIQYQSSFENKKSAVETVTPMKDKDGAWRVSGYYIK
jgi:hypothetical protein